MLENHRLRLHLSCVSSQDLHLLGAWDLASAASCSATWNIGRAAQIWAVGLSCWAGLGERKL